MKSLRYTNELGGNYSKTDEKNKQQLRKPFPYQMLFTEARHLEIFKSGNLFRYVQWDIAVPKNLREAFGSF